MKSLKGGVEVLYIFATLAFIVHSKAYYSYLVKTTCASNSKFHLEKLWNIMSTSLWASNGA